MSKRAIAVAGAALVLAGQAMAAEDVMVVFDGSNSMWGQIGGSAKIEIARNAMGGLIGDWTRDANVGLMAYGHRREGDCSDIETVIPPSPFDRQRFLAEAESITPRGKTPLTRAVRQAAETLSYRDNPATVVLITDGIESCQGDPCALAGELEQMGVGFTAHVVGFDLKDEEQEAVACMAERTGGLFVPANDAGELATALSEVGVMVAQEAEPEPEPTPEPEPEPAPASDVVLNAPGSVTMGASFDVSWQAEDQHSDDLVTIVPMGADEDEYGHYLRARDNSEGTLRAPAETGLYEVRYVLDEGRVTLGSAPIEVTQAETSVEAPESVVAGQAFPVSWSRAIHHDDLVTIVAMGADQDEYGHYIRVRDNSEGTLRAPAETGLYEVRYVLDEGRPTLASAPVEVTQAQASVEAPESVVAGEAFPVSWSNTIHPDDLVTIVPVGADQDEYGHYIRARDNSEGTLRAPAETGLYEVRYVLDEGRVTLGSAPIEVTQAETSVEAPESVVAGQTFAVSWSRAFHHDDLVTIVAMGADQDQYGDYVRVRDSNEGTLQAPAEPGRYEVRYVLDEGRVTLASAPIEITAAQASIKAPQSAVVGSTFPVQWSRAIHPDDYVTIVPMGAAEDTYEDYTRLRDNSEGSLRAPAQAGLYEVRYVLNEGRKVLASSEIEIVEAGIELSGPDTVRADSEIEVTWSGMPPHPRDYVTIVPMGADEGDYGDYARVRDSDTAELTAPEQTGLYEVRYVLDEGGRTLARHTLEVVGANAPLNDGGTLDAPETAAPGETVEVSWTAQSGGNDQRVTLASPDQAEFTWIEAQPASQGALGFTLPDEPGFYEFRLLDVTERKVLSRVTVAVE